MRSSHEHGRFRFKTLETKVKGVSKKYKIDYSKVERGRKRLHTGYFLEKKAPMHVPANKTSKDYLAEYLDFIRGIKRVRTKPAYRKEMQI